MRLKSLDERIQLIQGDITRLKVDAIVNAANHGLWGGGGVDGAIHRAAGPELSEACGRIRNAQGGCPTGEAVITPAGRLAARYVIHTVGPVWNGGGENEVELLAACYRNSLKLAVDHAVKTIAFPNISTGVYRFPKRLAAGIALREMGDFLRQDRNLEAVMLVCFDAENYAIYLQWDGRE